MAALEPPGEFTVVMGQFPKSSFPNRVVKELITKLDHKGHQNECHAEVGLSFSLTPPSLVTWDGRLGYALGVLMGCGCLLGPKTLLFLGLRLHDCLPVRCHQIYCIVCLESSMLTFH